MEEGNLSVVEFVQALKELDLLCETMYRTGKAIQENLQKLFTDIDEGEIAASGTTSDAAAQTDTDKSIDQHSSESFETPCDSWDEETTISGRINTTFDFEISPDPENKPEVEAPCEDQPKRKTKKSKRRFWRSLFCCWKPSI